MSRLLSEEKPGEEPENMSIGTFDVTVGGVHYHNSAIKFWTGLIDELITYYPGSDTIVLEATADKPLSRKDLEPQAELEEAVQEFESINMAEVFERTIQQMELLGPPQPVEARVLQKDKELFRRTLPLECVDANLFPYLAAWLLYMGNVAPSYWDAEMTAGDFEAIDEKRSLFYEMRFVVRTKHLHEGLHRREVQIEWAVS